MKRFRPKDDQQGPVRGNTWTDFKGQEQGNETHVSTTDGEAKLVHGGSGTEARLCFASHVAMENYQGLCVFFVVCPAVGAPKCAVAVD